MAFMSQNQSNPPQESAADKVERLKLKIAQSLKDRQQPVGGPSESAARAEAMLAQVRARLMGGQAAAGSSVVRQWMDADK